MPGQLDSIGIVVGNSNRDSNSTVVIVGNDKGQSTITPVVTGTTQILAVVRPVQEVVAQQPIVLSDRALVGPQGIQGIQGIPGTPGEGDAPYDQRADIVSDFLIYKGQAAPGAIPTDPVWRIRRLTIDPEGDVVDELANGNASFTNVWADRATLTY